MPPGVNLSWRPEMLKLNEIWKTCPATSSWMVLNFLFGDVEQNHPFLTWNCSPPPSTDQLTKLFQKHDNGRCCCELNPDILWQKNIQKDNSCLQQQEKPHDEIVNIVKDRQELKVPCSQKRVYNPVCNSHIQRKKGFKKKKKKRDISIKKSKKSKEKLNLY